MVEWRSYNSTPPTRLHGMVLNSLSTAVPFTSPHVMRCPYNRRGSYGKMMAAYQSGLHPEWRK
jgi:hypothetical protein